MRVAADDTNAPMTGMRLMPRAGTTGRRGGESTAYGKPGRVNRLPGRRCPLPETDIPAKFRIPFKRTERLRASRYQALWTSARSARREFISGSLGFSKVLQNASVAA